MEEEVWKKIPGFGDGYEVSDQGRVRSTGRPFEHPKGSGRLCRKKGRVLKTGSRSGYPSVTLAYEGKKLNRTVHRLVATAFLDNPDGLVAVNHKNGDKKDNRKVNLEWVSNLDNARHANDTGLVNNNGHRNTQAVLTQDQVDFIREHYKPRDRELGGAALGRKFGVTGSAILYAAHGKTWRR